MLFASHLSRCPSLIDTTGLFPAGLVLRMFILNSLIRFRAISVDTVVANGWARARARIIGRGHCHVYIVLGTIVVISFARYVRCPHPRSAFSDSDSAAASVPIVAASRFRAPDGVCLTLRRRLMLLPAMIWLGSQILGWPMVDMETVMQVRGALAARRLQMQLRFY